MDYSDLKNRQGQMLKTNLRSVKRYLNNVQAEGDGDTAVSSIAWTSDEEQELSMAPSECVESSHSSQNPAKLQKAKSATNSNGKVVNMISSQNTMIFGT
jgi:hypothetical protein